MLEESRLINKIRDEFGRVPFPYHRGLCAAMAMDDWVTDVKILEEITRAKDFVGEWWEVPVEELTSCMLAHSYLDDHGIEFYLPAYMVAVLERPLAFDRPGRSSAWQLIYLMCFDKDKPMELREHFRATFSRIVGGRKQACRDFLRFVAASSSYNEHANQLAKEALSSEFWAGS